MTFASQAEREEWHSSVLFLGWLIGQMHWEEIIGAEFSPLHARSLLCVLLHVLAILAKENSLLESPVSSSLCIVNQSIHV